MAEQQKAPVKTPEKADHEDKLPATPEPGETQQEANDRVRKAQEGRREPVTR